MRIDRPFARLLAQISLPIVFQQLLAQGMYLLDSLMIGTLGQDEIVAVSNAGQITFLFNMFLFGAVSAASVFTSQFWGKGDNDGIKKTFSLCLIIACVIMLPFFALSLIVPEALLSIVNPDKAVVAIAAPYLRVVSISFVFTAFTQAITSSLKGMCKVRVPMYVSVLTVGVNALINYTLIFGNFGFPRLGVVGAAIGTAVAFCIETIVLGAYYLSKRNPSRFRLRELTLKDGAFVRSYLKTAAPVLINEMLWSTGNFIIVMLYNRLSRDMAGAMAVYVVVEKMCYVFYSGLANSTGIIVGNKIGEGNAGLAYAYAGNCLMLGPVMGVAIGSLVIALTNPIISLYVLTPSAQDILRQIFLMLPLTMSLSVFNFVNLAGVLRGGGDTRFAALTDLCILYGVAIPCSYVAGMVLHWGGPFVFLTYILSGDVIKMIIGFKRFKTKKWINNLTRYSGA